MGYFGIVLTAIATAWLSLAIPALAQVPAPTLAQSAAAGQSQTVVGGSVLNPTQAAISGNIVSPAGQPLTNITAQARNLLTAQVGGSATATTTGQYAIVGLNPGYYVVEIVDPLGQVIGTSGFIAAPAGVAVTAAVTATTTGALTAVSAATGLAATVGGTAARSMSFMAAAAGVTGVVAPPEVPVASPSR